MLRLCLPCYSGILACDVPGLLQAWALIVSILCRAFNSLLLLLLLLLQERLEMMNHDRLSEVFHREILKQEEAQERKKLIAKHEAERATLSAKHETDRLDLREENEALKLAHNNEKIRIRWEHMDEVCAVGGA